MENIRLRKVNAKWTLLNGEFRSNVVISIGGSGLIENIEEVASIPDDVLYLGDVALTPGFVNAHSHAFHRELRGRSEIGSLEGDSFWKWRNNMYALLDEIDEQKLEHTCARTFSEMLSAGITSVGEFHYVHHQTPEIRWNLDRAVIRAARKVGIRLVLLETLYQRAGFDETRPLHEQQRKFTSELGDFLGNVRRLKAEEEHDLITIGVAAHSLRAVSLVNTSELWRFASQNNLPLHIHVEEQPQEIVDCKEHHGQSPSTLLLDTLEGLNPENGARLTLVHCTYTSAENQAALSKNGVNVCLCPCTEGYLGDGIPLINADSHLSFGTDCNNRIDMLEEARWAAFSQHMKHNSRSVAGLSAGKLLDSATRGGARALGLEDKVGQLAVGLQFDVVAIDTSAGPLLGVPGPELVDALVFGAGAREVLFVYVGGKLVHHHSQR